MKLMRFFNTPGLLVGTLLFAFSLTPTLLPRADVVQGVLSGVSLSAGYAIGVLGHGLWLYLGLPRYRARTRRLIQITAASVCVLTALVFLWQAAEWQDGVRQLMQMEEDAVIRPLVVGLVALALFLSVLVVAKLFLQTFRFLSGKLQRYIPPRIAHVAGTLVAVFIFWSVIDDVVFTTALRVADNSYQQIDALMEPGTPKPADPVRTGSAESLLDWEELGRQGRRYLTFAPTAAQIAELVAGETQDAIRVYVGMNSADTPEARAALALAELQRVGGFDRKTLVLVTPTGTGWIDPAAVEPLEYLHRGDIASVAAQYSYLPSPLSLIQEGEYGTEMARALFQSIYGHWRELPADDRPDLYLHGLSLGALNSDRSFDLYDIIDDPFQGALWSGPPFRSETWRSVTSRRNPDSPAWLPEFRDNSVVRFANQYQGLDDVDGEWGAFRIAFLQYASDPVTFFDPRAFYREPDWMAAERAPDVSESLRWIPVVTMLQLAADMGAGVSPRGFGHEYAAEDYLEAWIALTEPENLSPRDLQRLRVAYSQQDALLDPDDGH